MTLQEALDTDVSATVDYIKRNISIKDGERLDELIRTLKAYAYSGFYTKLDARK